VDLHVGRQDIVQSNALRSAGLSEQDEPEPEPYRNESDFRLVVEQKSQQQTKNEKDCRSNTHSPFSD
jgi:hypothetical protein